MLTVNKHSAFQNNLINSNATDYFEQKALKEYSMV
jgi:hypothetical protein